MAFHNETYLASDEMDYDIDSTITRADARKGFAARISGGQANASGRPVAGKSNATGQVVIGAITHVGRKGCKVVKNGRFVLQSTEAFAASDVGKKVISVAPGSGGVNIGKVTHAAGSDGTEIAQKGDLAIVGGGNDTDDGGIGHFFLVERL